MSTSSDNVPSSASNWELENKRVPSSESVAEESSRADGVRARVCQAERAGYWTLQKQFSPTIPATLFRPRVRACFVNHAWLGCIPFLPPAPEKFRRWKRAQFSGEDWEERDTLIRCLRPYRLIRFLCALNHSRRCDPSALHPRAIPRLRVALNSIA